jgi:hypothetical protein
MLLTLGTSEKLHECAVHLISTLLCAVVYANNDKKNWKERDRISNNSWHNF